VRRLQEGHRGHLLRGGREDRLRQGLRRGNDHYFGVTLSVFVL